MVFIDTRKRIKSLCTRKTLDCSFHFSENRQSLLTCEVFASTRYVWNTAAAPVKDQDVAPPGFLSKVISFIHVYMQVY